MKLVLSATQVDVLRKEALAAQNDAELRYIAARKTLEDSERAFDAAKANYSNTLKVRTGAEVILDLGGLPKFVFPDKDDFRPKGWRDYFGYIVPSASGRKQNHEITINGVPNYPDTAVSCSCPAFSKGHRDCWAVKGIRAGMRLNYKSEPYILSPNGKEVVIKAVLAKSQRPDFGLAEQD